MIYLRIITGLCAILLTADAHAVAANVCGYRYCSGSNEKQCDHAKALVDKTYKAIQIKGCKAIINKINWKELNDHGMYLFVGHAKPPYQVIANGFNRRIIGMTVDQRQILIRQNDCKNNACTLNLKKIITKMAKTSQKKPCFISYPYFEKPFQGKLVNKVSYVRSFNCGTDEPFYIGAGFYPAVQKK